MELLLYIPIAFIAVIIVLLMRRRKTPGAGEGYPSPVLVTTQPDYSYLGTGTFGSMDAPTAHPHSHHHTAPCIDVSSISSSVAHAGSCAASSIGCDSGSSSACSGQ